VLLGVGLDAAPSDEEFKGRVGVRAYKETCGATWRGFVDPQLRILGQSRVSKMATHCRLGFNSLHVVLNLGSLFIFSIFNFSLNL
jgi:hypothetical protein